MVRGYWEAAQPCRNEFSINLYRRVCSRWPHIRGCCHGSRGRRFSADPTVIRMARTRVEELLLERLENRPTVVMIAQHFALIPNPYLAPFKMAYQTSAHLPITRPMEGSHSLFCVPGHERNSCNETVGMPAKAAFAATYVFRIPPRT